MRICAFLIFLACNLSAHQERFQGEWWNPPPDAVCTRMVGKSWNDQCPVPLDDLAYIRVTHWNMRHKLVIGELVVYKALAQDVVEIFHELFDRGFPIEQMVLIDDYDADDEWSMSCNNTSAFCFRQNTTKPGLISKHGYGCAIDINPLLNPYIRGDLVLPHNAERYLDRDQDIPGMIREGGPCYEAFTKRGWFWGGHFEGRTDYQHFETELINPR